MLHVIALFSYRCGLSLCPCPAPLFTHHEGVCRFKLFAVILLYCCSISAALWSKQTLQALRNLLQSVPLWSLYPIAPATAAASHSEEHESVEQARAGTILNVAQRNVERAVLYSSGRSREAEWRGWESRYSEQGGVIARRHYWGGLEVPPAPRSGFQSSVQNGSPESMDVEMEFQSGRRSHESTMGGREEAAAGLIKLVDVILGKLEGSPSGDGCDETTCAVSLVSFTHSVYSYCRPA